MSLMLLKRVVQKFRKTLFNRYYRGDLQKRYRMQIKNSNFSIICNNCFGGMLYHDLGMQFLSPTINMRFDAAEYVTFLNNLKFYLQCDDFVDGGNIPTGGRLAILGGKIRLFGLHYKTFDELREKWFERRERVNYDNLFVIGSYIDDCNDDIARSFCALPHKNKIFLSHKHIDNCGESLVVAKCGKNATGFPGADYMLSSKIRFEDSVFNFIDWFNQGL